MDTWDDVGGSDLWLHDDKMPKQHYDVWHCDEKKRSIWTPNATWTYRGNIDWFTYGTPKAAPKAASKAAPMAAARTARGTKRRASTQLD